MAEYKTFKLSRPFPVNGKEVAELEYDLDSLTGEDIIQVNTDLTKMQYVAPVKETDEIYNLGLFAIATREGLSLHDLRKLPARDVKNINTLVMNFFLVDSAG